MRIFDVTNLNSGVENIAIRVGETGNYEHTVESNIKKSLGDNVVDIKSDNNKFMIYVFKDNCRTNVLDKSVNDNDISKVRIL